MRILVVFICLLPQFAFSQENELAIFGNLLNQTWLAEGEWNSGGVFKQEVSFEYILDSNIIITKSKGFIDENQSEFGERNFGLRKYDPIKREINFWEYDVFGGITDGVVFQVDKNLVYYYQYGNLFLTEIWGFVNDSTYDYKIGIYENEDWQEVFLDTQFKAIKKSPVEVVYSSLQSKLNGNWSSKAWDGQLNESWVTDSKGHLTQKAEYVEGQEVLYEATNKIEIVNGELILFTLIKNNNPKIFKASSFSETSIVFENSDYSNPNKVVYDLIAIDEFHRTISGIEDGKATSYTFKFEKEIRE